MVLGGKLSRFSRDHRPSRAHEPPYAPRHRAFLGSGYRARNRRDDASTLMPAREQLSKKYDPEGMRSY